MLYQEMERKFGKKKVEDELSRAKKLFKKYDVNKSGYLERSEITAMMRDSYKAMRKAFNPSEAQIDQFIKMMDTSNNHMISLDEYEVHILRSLQKRNLHI